VHSACQALDGRQAKGPEARSRRARACISEAKASREGIVFRVMLLSA